MSGNFFSLYTRTRKTDGKKVYYCRFKLPDGTYGTGRSTGCTNRTKAIAWAIEELQKGQVVIKKKVSFEDFSRDFFEWSGPWAENHRALGKRLSPRHCMERGDLLKNHLLPHFGPMKLTSINLKILEKFRNEFKQKYSGSTTNKALSVLRAILKEAYRQKLISNVPEVELCGLDAQARGKLTIEEATRLFLSVDWCDYKAFVACFLAAKTGMRLSEILALQVGDIDSLDGFIEIKKVYDTRTRTIKHETKSGKIRVVPLASDVLEHLKKLASENPHLETAGKNAFLFYGKNDDAPINAAFLLAPLYDVLEQIGISDKERRERGIVFHSFRYLANSFLIDSGIEAEAVRSVVGHADEGMTQRYYRATDQHEQIKHVLEGMFMPVDKKSNTEH